MLRQMKNIISEKLTFNLLFYSIFLVRNLAKPEKLCPKNCCHYDVIINYIQIVFIMNERSYPIVPL